MRRIKWDNKEKGEENQKLKWKEVRSREREKK
jgi:hypothetical protein